MPRFSIVFRTNHNHEEIIENIETYQCVAIKSLEM